MFSAQSVLSLYSATTAWNTAIGAFTGTKLYSLSPETEEDDGPLSGTLAVPSDTTSVEGNVCAQHIMSILICDELSRSSEDTCSLSVASCSKRRKCVACDDNEPSELCSENSFWSPENLFSPAQAKSFPIFDPVASLMTGDFATPFAPRNGIMRVASTSAGGEGYPANPPQIMGQTGASSVALMRKAISVPLVKTGIVRKCKEKQD